MPWSKLKQRIEETFADSVRGRVELHQTRYRRAHDQAGELWITLDGEQILSAGSYTAELMMAVISAEFESTGMSPRESSMRAHRELGLLDRRFGVRRLERFDPSGEHDFVARMFKLRCDLEGVSRKPTIGAAEPSARI